jgi:cysteine desulfurase/selenocysteine lyase
VDDPPLSPLDVGTRLNLEGIAVRTGHHCCQPLMERYNLSSTARASFAVYNTRKEIDSFASALARIVDDAREQAKSAVASAPVAKSDVRYPAAAAASPQEAAGAIIDVFDYLEDWTLRYEHIIELGRRLLPLPAEFKTEENRVRGCQSTVFFSLRKKPGTGDVLEFLAESDADIVCGLIALLQKVYSGQRAEQVLAFDVEGFFNRLGLDSHLTLGRRNGLAAMVQRIRLFAASGLAQPKD